MMYDYFGLPVEYPPVIETPHPVTCRRCGHAQSRHRVCMDRLAAGWDKTRMVGLCVECGEDVAEDIDGGVFVPVGRLADE